MSLCCTSDSTYIVHTNILYVITINNHITYVIVSTLPLGFNLMYCLYIFCVIMTLYVKIIQNFLVSWSTYRQHFIKIHHSLSPMSCTQSELSTTLYANDFTGSINKHQQFSRQQTAMHNSWSTLTISVCRFLAAFISSISFEASSSCCCSEAILPYKMIVFTNISWLQHTQQKTNNKTSVNRTHLHFYSSFIIAKIW